tara:strand:- start:3200 stop:5227 length:2028 start_codon:yes stop_codon:yes gene_type:complete
MAINNKVNNNFRDKGKSINYLNKDFKAFRENLIEFAKTYFPKTHADFNESSPGMMFIEMASYIGDVLGYYIDDTLKESLMPFAEDKRNVLALAKYLGYKTKVTSPAVTEISIFQLVPSKFKTGTSNDFEPDTKFYLRIKEGMQTTSTNGVTFVTTELLDFNESEGREITVYSKNASTGEPEFYLVKKTVKAISAVLKEKEISFGPSSDFAKIDLDDTDVISVYDVRDSNSNKYYEVPYLGQEMIFVDYPNTAANEPDFFQFREDVPSILRTLKTSRRFTTVVNEDFTTTIQFGSGDGNTNDELIIPNFDNIGLGLVSSNDRLNEFYDPANFLKTKSYGQSPTNTTITVKYFVGGGISSNVKKGDIKQITSVEFEDDTASFNDEELLLRNTVINSIACENEIPATGGRGAETITEIKENALAYFGAQNRAVTAEDYTVRALAMPAKFGSVAKAFVVQDSKLDQNSPSGLIAQPKKQQEFLDLAKSVQTLDDAQAIDTLDAFVKANINKANDGSNPFSINIYTLGYNTNKNLTTINSAIKENLKTYINQFKMISDGINIVDGYIINFCINFDISILSGYNRREVLTNCNLALQDYFNIDNWTFNDTININEVELILANQEGVVSVAKLEFINKCGGNYSPRSYNFEEATRSKIIYPSLDPSIFELKFPNQDIKGRVI